jgi:hypothetical protein
MRRNLGRRSVHRKKNATKIKEISQEKNRMRRMKNEERGLRVRWRKRDQLVVFKTKIRTRELARAGFYPYKAYYMVDEEI